MKQGTNGYQYKNEDNGRNTENGQIKVPVRLEPETLANFRELNPSVKIEYLLIGDQVRPYAIYYLPKGEAEAFLKIQQAEIKQEQRERRCRVPDGKGGFIRCPEKNKCWQCTKPRSFGFDNGHEASFEDVEPCCRDGKSGTGWVRVEGAESPEPYLDAQTPEDVETAILAKMLLEQISTINSKYGDIFSERLKGNMKPYTIAKELNVGKSRMYLLIPKVEKILQELYEKAVREQG